MSVVDTNEAGSWVGVVFPQRTTFHRGNVDKEFHGFIQQAERINVITDDTAD